MKACRRTVLVHSGCLLVHPYIDLSVERGLSMSPSSSPRNKYCTGRSATEGSQVPREDHVEYISRNWHSISVTGVLLLMDLASSGYRDCQCSELL